MGQARGTRPTPNHRCREKTGSSQTLESEDATAKDVPKQEGSGHPEVLGKVGQDLRCCRSDLPRLGPQTQSQTVQLE